MGINAQLASESPYVGSALVSATANTATTSPGTTGQASIYTAGGAGAKIEEIDVVMTGTGVAGVLYLWRWVGGTGTTYYLVDSVAIGTTLTAGAVVPLTYANLFLNGGDVLTVTSSVANQPAQVNAYGGSF